MKVIPEVKNNFHHLPGIVGQTTPLPNPRITAEKYNPYSFLTSVRSGKPMISIERQR